MPPQRCVKQKIKGKLDFETVSEKSEESDGIFDSLINRTDKCRLPCFDGFEGIFFGF